MYQRLEKVAYYLEIAKVVAKRGTCLRRNYGAVLVKDDEIIATGYTGAPRGASNCCDTGACERERLGCKPGERYELCRSVHAEQNCLISASRKDSLGATLYLAGIDAKTGEVITAVPCALCQRMLTNAGVLDYYGTLSENDKAISTAEYSHHFIREFVF